ncbi:DUF1692-domain-containing protein [Basidiobolus meristosporus CBS 931.73]|uniref:DUF1692-domain-containing protein n=1 Tax=Basidiobolus meristosporus CBS 931.73 TaxID=1314790 RepID=A0A1Y1XS05_9FUNG|nr:DUF1692-domain-containing protein [Basidiobolus meristosporus CBS 931.73]|eukprot:ORX88530.1 DUF1692-domain-containing protein [Basidiobolus meristosporus CBS 931.73]
MFSRLQKKLANLDAFPKVDEGYQRRSKSGGLVSFLISLVLFYLIQSEVREYLTTKQEFEFLVDPNIEHTMQVNLDVYLAMDCENLTVDVLDAAGASSRVKHSLNVVPVYYTFAPLESRPVNQKEPEEDIDVEQIIRDARKSEKRSDALDAEEYNACRVSGSMKVNKVAGNLHITAFGHGYGGSHVDHEALNFTHYIRHLSFGHNYPHLVNPLNNVYERAESNFDLFQYFISIVPTIYLDSADNVLLTNQYAVTDSSKSLEPGMQQTQVPGIFFKYDLEPISVRVSETRPPFPTFLVRLCGLVGGIWATTGVTYQLIRLVTRRAH